MIEHGPWKIIRQHEVFRDPWLTVRHDEVIRPDDRPGTYSVVEIKSGVCVVALDHLHQVHLTEEFHYGVGRITREGVSGGCDAGETPHTTAQRELREELGISAQRWTSLGVCDPFTANVVSPTHLFLAEEISVGLPNPEGTERIRHIAIPLPQAIEQAISGEISHAPSALLILKIACLRLMPNQVS